MDFDQIIKLVDAGYSKEEIAAMMQKEPKEQKEQKEPKEQKEQNEQKEQKEQPKTGSLDDAIAKLDSLGSKLDKYADSMAKLAIMNSQQPPKQDMNNFLASIINPHYNEEDKK